MADLGQFPVADDARMARALEWVRTAARGNVGEGDALRVALVESARKHLPAIEEAIAAYNPNCGARTVRVVDEAARLMCICQNAHDRLLRGDDDSELLAMLEQAWSAHEAVESP